MKVGKSIQDIRKKNDLSQEAFGEMFHVTRQTVSNWENEKSYPDLQTLIAISERFEVSLDTLMKENPEIIRKIDKNRKQVNNVTLLLIGCFPFVTGLFMCVWDRYMFNWQSGYWGSLLCLLVWGIACYKVASSDRSLFLQASLLNIGGVFSLIENVLVQFEIMEPLKCGYLIINQYLMNSLKYPWGAYIAFINRQIDLCNSGDPNAMAWLDKMQHAAIPETVYIYIIAWIIMVAVSVIGIVLKVKGYGFDFKARFF